MYLSSEKSVARPISVAYQMCCSSFQIKTANLKQAEKQMFLRLGNNHWGNQNYSTLKRLFFFFFLETLSSKLQGQHSFQLSRSFPSFNVLLIQRSGAKKLENCKIT